MKIKRILVSQPVPQIAEKSPFNEIILKHSVQVNFHPFIKVVGVNLKEFRSQRVEILEHTAIVFSSRTTIDSFFRICDEARITIPESMKYFCMTEAVALYLQKHIVYRKRKIFFADGSFPNFMSLLLKHKEENYLLTLSEPHKPEMPLGMERLKLNFEKVILARTVSADLESVDVQEYDLLVFYSPSEITSLVGKFADKINGKPLIATFGHGTAKAAQAAGLAISVMAPTPEIPSMTKAIDVYINKINSGQAVDKVVLESESPDIAFIQAQGEKVAKRANRPVAKATDKKGVATKSTAAATKKTTAKSTTKPIAKAAVKTAVAAKVAKPTAENTNAVPKKRAQ